MVADANGRWPSIFLTPSTAYKIQLWTAATTDDPVGSQIWSFDPCGPAAGGVPTNTAGIIGEVRTFAGPSTAVPSQWYLCYGQQVSRTTYASLFTVIGTTYGSGDGTTTFNLPDLRGRIEVGKDDMGGSAASRITSGVSGINGATLGAAGGSQIPDAGVLSANSVSVVTDPGHTHTLPAVAPTSTPGVGIAGVGTGFSFAIRHKRIIEDRRHGRDHHNRDQHCHGDLRQRAAQRHNEQNHLRWRVTLPRRLRSPDR